IGKTRLARQALATIGDRSVAVDLAPITHDVAEAVARRFGITAQPGEATTAGLVRHLGQARMTLLLDTCERVLDEVATLVAALLDGCPHLAVLATSRERLGVEGEQVLAVPPLPVEGGAAAGVLLFRHRAAQVRSGVVDEPDDVLVELCRRLDGIPLAIELAAARAAALGAEDLLDALRDRFDVLSGGPRTAHERQATMEASVAWSYDLLDDVQQRALRALAVFRGPFTLGGATAVAGEPGGPPALSTVAALVDRSLLVLLGGGRVVRYRFLDTIRDFALARLVQDGPEHERVRGRHLDWFVARAEQLAGRGPDADQSAHLADLQLELPDIDAAVATAADTSRPGPALQLVGALWRFWWAGRLDDGGATRGHGLAIVEAALAVPGGTPAARARAEVAAVLAAGARFDLGAALAHGAVAVREAEVSADDSVIAAAHCWYGWMLVSADPVAARDHLDRAIALARRARPAAAMVRADALDALATLEVAHGDLEAGLRRVAEVLALAEAHGDRLTQCQALATFATALYMRGRLDASEEAVDRALAIARTTGDAVYSVMLLNGATRIDTLRRDDARARDRIAEARRTALRSGFPQLETITGAAEGLAREARGDRGPCIEPLSRALPVLRFVAPALAVEALAALVRAHHHLGQPELAAAHARTAETLGATTASAWLRGRAELVTALDQRDRDPDAAAVAAGRAATAAAEAGDSVGEVQAVHLLGVLAAGHDDRTALGLLAAAAAGRANLGVGASEHEQEEAAAVAAAARPALGDDGIAAAEAQGARLSPAAALALAARRAGDGSRPVTGWGSLTAAERRVADLVADGLSNPEIAGHLFVSRETVKGHVSSTLRKLGASSRVHLALIAAEHRRPG
ncbi:MAG TPA: LuxR C-terminal-related transcriptional regulator, partial [Iamia sp.]|nr:LuxR C-terminal-related transcriptional regulator [Iamia sp.]